MSRPRGSRGQSLEPAPRPKDVVLLFNKHRIVEREEFLTSIWREGSMRENSLLQCIRELRLILGDNAQHPIYIKTYFTNGYQWIHTGTLIIAAITDTDKSRSVKQTNSTTINNPVPPDSISKLRFTNLSMKIKPSRFLMSGVVLLMFIVSFLFVSKSGFINQADNDQNSLILAVVPFSNQTGDASLQWVQLGLSDMVLSALAQSSRIRVIPMHVVQQVLSEQSLTLSTKELLLALNADYLIQSNITQTNLKTYQFNYKVFNLNGVVSSQTLPTTDIITAIPTIVRQFSNQLLPENNDLLTLLNLSTNNQANSDYANGIQALKTKGSPLARRYFEAALINDPNFMWAKAQLALVFSKLGEWKKAKVQFKEMLLQQEINKNPALKSFINLALANIFLEQSQFNQAETLLHTVMTLSEKNINDYSKVDALWGLSRIAENRSQWQKQNNFAQQAISLSSSKANELRIKADNLYYLGSPSNSRLEFDKTIDMQQNRERLEQALDYYTQLKDVESQAKTLLSMGGNYTFNFEQRIGFLDDATKLFRKLGNKMQLVNTLSYTGFLYIQYHQGGNALFPLQTSIQIVKSIGAVQAELLNHYLLAFAALDQATNPENSKEKTQYLSIAAQQFVNLRSDPRLHQNSQLYADSTLLLAWTVSEQGKHTLAINYIKKAETVYRSLNLTTSISYSTMSLVKEHVALQNWKQALQFINRPNQNKRTRQYFARSYYELKQYNKALTIAERNKSSSLGTWTSQDDAQLNRYRLVNANKQYQQLPPEPSAHTTYCEPLPENT